MSYRRMRLAVGLFVVTFTLLLVLFAALVLKEKGFFEEKLRFDFYTESAQPFHIGMSLLFSGFEIGTISDIALTKEGRVHVTFEIAQSNAKWICEDTLLMLEKPLIGSPTIDVLSSLAYAPLPAGSTLGIIIRDDINDIITNVEPVVNDLQSIVTSVNTITSRIASADSDLFATMQNLRRFTGNLAHEKALLNTITGDGQSTEQLKKTLSEAASTVSSVHDLVKQMSKAVETLETTVITPSGGAVKEFDAVLSDVRSKLERLEGVVDAVSSYDRDLVELKEQIRFGVEKSNRLIDKIDTILEGHASPEATLP